MRVAFHHAQLIITRINALDSARMGLDSLEQWYGLPKAMFEDRRVQHYPNDYLFTNEQDRFGEAGRLPDAVNVEGLRAEQQGARLVLLRLERGRLQLLQEAGFHPLEVIRSATLNGAELLSVNYQTGTIAADKMADLVQAVID